MGTIAHLYEWAARRRIDLDQRLASGNGLRPFELQALFQNLRFRRPDGRALADHDIIDLHERDTVDWRTLATRCAVTRRYLIWNLEQALYELDVSDVRSTAIRERCELIRRQSKEFERSAVSTGSPRRGLSVSCG